MTYIRLDRLRQQYRPQIPLTLKKGYQLHETPLEYPKDDYNEVKARFTHTFGLPLVTLEPLPALTLEEQLASYTSDNGEEQKRKGKNENRPLNVGVMFSGGQAPGGHNVIAGILDALKGYSPSSKLYGFLMGPGGLLRGEYKELSPGLVHRYRNSGGFDMIGSDRTKIEKEEDFEKVRQLAQRLDLNAIIIIGGDDSNTNAALLAEYMAEKGCPLQVIGCPKTIDGDLKNRYIETSFGFDTCVKVYAELVGNIQRDCFSAKKYYHFIKLMGRSASHLTLECALMCQPTMAIISEEIRDRAISLDVLVSQIADVIVARSNEGLSFGTVLIPEGLIEFLPGIDALLAELNRLPLNKEKEQDEPFGKASHALEYSPKPIPSDKHQQVAEIAEQLSAENAKLFRLLPTDIALSLATERDPHGNVQVSRIPTEELIADLVTQELESRKQKGMFAGSFAALTHFFGYEGRSSMPSNFDASYCYSLGRCAIELIANGKSGYMATIRNLVAHPTDWIATGLPLTVMIDFEERKGGLRPVIGKTIVDLRGVPMQYFRSKRKQWASEVHFRYPGPLQFFGPSAICDNTTITLRLEQGLTPYEDVESLA